jgi:hypothetical protein
VNGVEYVHALTAAVPCGETATIEYQLADKQWTRLVFTPGFSDESPEGSEAVLVVHVDEAPVLVASLTPGRAVPVELDVTEGRSLRFEIHSDSCEAGPQAKVVIGGPRLLAGSGGCHSAYSGCVPIDHDVDCAGGSGNGPSYVEGPVEVIGSDEYELDPDGDGVGCE